MYGSKRAIARVYVQTLEFMCKAVLRNKVLSKNNVNSIVHTGVNGVDPSTGQARIAPR